MDTRLYKQAQKLFRQGLDLLFPPRCAGCQHSGHLLCPACLHSMQPLPLPVCQQCGLPLTTASAHTCSCERYPLHLHGIRCAQLYHGALHNAIRELKYTGHPRLAEPLGHLLAQTFSHRHMYADGLIPLPLHPQREKHRGYNQATLLARNCATHLKVPCLENLVIRVRDTRAQVGLNAQQRQHNVQAAFTLAPGTPTQALTHMTLVIIDDVCTTGATLEACAAPLYTAGAREIWGLVLGRPSQVSPHASKDML